MASTHQNLSSTFAENKYDGSTFKIGIVVAQWNKDITGPLLDGAVTALKDNGVPSDAVTVIEVPGAFELPIGARMLLQSGSLDGIICLGCVIKGETKHDEYISNAVASGIMTLGLTSGKPIIFGLLTPNNHEQAVERSGGVHGNKGTEAAMSLLQMLEVKKGLKAPKKGIGFQ